MQNSSGLLVHYLGQTIRLSGHLTSTLDGQEITGDQIESILNSYFHRNEISGDLFCGWRKAQLSDNHILRFPTTKAMSHLDLAYPPDDSDLQAYKRIFCKNFRHYGGRLRTDGFITSLGGKQIIPVILPPTLEVISLTMDTTIGECMMMDNKLAPLDASGLKYNVLNKPLHQDSRHLQQLPTNHAIFTPVDMAGREFPELSYEVKTEQGFEIACGLALLGAYEQLVLRQQGRRVSIGWNEKESAIRHLNVRLEGDGIRSSLRNFITEAHFSSKGSNKQNILLKIDKGENSPCSWLLSLNSQYQINKIERNSPESTKLKSISLPDSLSANILKILGEKVKLYYLGAGNSFAAIE